MEQYGWSVVRRSPLPWQWLGIGVVVSMMWMSLVNVKNSVVGARDLRQVIEKAAERGDYGMAEQLYTTEDVQVLGASNELEDLVYPERVVERRIAELEQKLEDYPGNREIFLAMAELYREIGNTEKSQEYFEQARILDPNNAIFQP